MSSDYPRYGRLRSVGVGNDRMFKGRIADRDERAIGAAGGEALPYHGTGAGAPFLLSWERR